MSKVYIDKNEIQRLVGNNISVITALSKMVTDEHKNKNQKNKKRESSIAGIESRVKGHVSRNCATKEYLTLFNDLKLAADILLTLILSPKDMSVTELNYSSDFEYISADTLNYIINKVSMYLESEYKITRYMDRHCRDMIIGSGAVIHAIIPENSLDDIIRGKRTLSTESLSELLDGTKTVPIGILGDGDDTGDDFVLESILDNSMVRHRPAYLHGDTKREVSLDEQILQGLDITDNFNIMKLPAIIDGQRKRKLNNILTRNSMSLEALEYDKEKRKKRLEEEKVQQKEYDDKVSYLYAKVDDKTEGEIDINTREEGSRDAIGKPLRIRVPKESCVVVHKPGNPEEHVGYFLSHDSNGYPLDVRSNEEGMSDEVSDGDKVANDIAEKLDATTIGQSIIEKSKAELGNNTPRSKPSVGDAVQLYTETIERTLLKRLETGIYGKGLVIGGNEGLYRIMLARTLKAKNTRLLFIPVEMVSYKALKYDDEGRGINFLEEFNVISSMRAALMMSGIVSDIKANIPQTRINVGIDPEDQDASASMAVIINEALKMNQRNLPIGLSNITDFADWTHMAGYTMAFKSHPSLPDTSFDFEDITSSSNNAARTSFMDELRRQQHAGIGVPTEIVDNGFDSKLATVAESNRILMDKTAIRYRNIVNEFTTDYIHKIMHNDTNVEDIIKECLDMDKIKEGLTKKGKDKFAEDEETFKRNIFHDLINSFKVGIPDPDTNSLEVMAEKFEIYKETLSSVIDFWIGEMIVSYEILGDVGEVSELLKTSFMGYFVRKWQADHSFMTELSDMTSTDNDGKPIMKLGDIMDDHLQGVMGNVITYLKKMKMIRKKTAEIMRKLEEADNPDEEGVDGDGGFDGDRGSSGGDSFDSFGDGGFDTFSGDDSFEQSEEEDFENAESGEGDDVVDDETDDITDDTTDDETDGKKKKKKKKKKEGKDDTF